MEFCPPGRKKVAVSGVSTVLYSNAYRWIHEREVIPVRYIFEKAAREVMPMRYIFYKAAREVIYVRVFELNLLTMKMKNKVLRNLSLPLLISDRAHARLVTM